eukprot:573440-Hanusia_phi.AAC.1
MGSRRRQAARLVPQEITKTTLAIISAIPALRASTQTLERWFARHVGLTPTASQGARSQDA